MSTLTIEQTATLTSHEAAILEASLNYDNRQCQHEDNYSVCGLEEARDATGLNSHGVAGVLGSLEKKGLATYVEDDDLVWLSQKGVDAIFDVIESRAA